MAPLEASLSLRRLGQPGVRPVWLLGQPVGHSLSPLMQNLAFETLNLSAVYLACPVAPARFEEAVYVLPLLGSAGANLTVPHKETGYWLCQRLTPRAQAAGAVNCLRWREGVLEGDNTDGVGWLRGLRRQFGWQASGGRALLLGAGGAARGVGAALLNQGIEELVVLNRSASRAQTLLYELLDQVPHGVRTRPPRRVLAGGLELFEQELLSTDLVVQTTSSGLGGDGSPVPLPQEWPEGVLFSELIYGAPTPLLSRVRELGGEAQDGLPMLVNQAVEGIAWWFDLDPDQVPADRMEDAARRFLAAKAGGEGEGAG